MLLILFITQLYRTILARTINTLAAACAGQTMAEYGVILAVVALIVVLAAALLGVNLSTIFSNTSHRV